MNTTESADVIQSAIFRCVQCGYAAQVRFDALGKRGKCPKCGKVNRVTVADPQTETATEAHAVSSSGIVDVSAIPRHPDSDKPRPAVLAASHASQPRQQTAGQIRCPHCRQIIPDKAAEAAPAGRQDLRPVQAETPKRESPPESPAVPTTRSAANKPAQPGPVMSPASAARLAGETGHQKAEPTIRCPYCREQINQGARKCKHCGEFLDETLRCMSEQQSPSRWGVSHPDVSGRANIADGLAALTSRGPVRIAAVIVLVVGLGFGAMWLFHGNRGSAVVAAFGGAGAPGGGSASTNAVLDGLAKTLEKQLQETSTRNTAGSELNFQSSTKGIMPWLCEVQDGNAAGAPVKGLIYVPYKFDSAEAWIPSSRGRYVLEFAQRGRQWELTEVLKETRVFIKKGAEIPVPEDDIARVKQPDKDFVVTYLKGILRKANPGD